MSTTERPTLTDLGRRVSAAREAVEARGETFYPGASRVNLAAHPPKERWDDWVELDSRAWPRRVEHRSMLVPTTCFNCESACGLLAYVDRETLQVRKFEGNPEHPGSRGRNCAKGPATVNQVTDPDRILYPMRRAGERGEGRWEQVDWDTALDDIAARVRRAITESRPNAVMYHVGRPGEDGYTERVLASWGVDGHNSHTNVCSSGARAGYHFWTGIDRPSPDHANAEVMLLISSHLEAGHYFNPHAQRVMEAKQRGAKLIVIDTRLSNTATHADHWLSPHPGSEAAILLAVANGVIATGRYDREFVRRWWNWREYLVAAHPDLPPTFEAFEEVLSTLYADYTPEFAAAESGVPVDVIEAVTDLVASAGTRLSTHNWRSAAAGNLGGWQVSRTLFLLNALMGAVSTPGGTHPNAWNKFVPKPIHTPGHPPIWNELTWPTEYPLALNEMSFLLPHFLKDGRGTLDVYFTRVYNPVWTNPDGMTWSEVLRDRDLVGLHVALTPTWNETAYLADYVLPMGLASERHDLTSYEQYDGQWIGFRQPVLRAARERLGQRVTDTRQVNPGEVWEENEFWIELSWRIDPDGSLGIRQYHESREQPGAKLTVEEYYRYIFENSVPGLPEKAAAEGLDPMAYMRRYGAFEVSDHVGQVFEEEVDPALLGGAVETDLGRVYSSAPRPAPVNLAPTGAPVPDAEGRAPVGVRVDGVVRRGFPTPSGLLEFYSPTLVQWGWPEYAAAAVHPLPRPPRGARRGRAGAHLDVPAADAGPHPRRQRQVAQRARPDEPAVDPSPRCRRPRCRQRRPRPGLDRDRLLRRQGVGDRGDPSRRRRLQPPHGPVAAAGGGRATGRADGGDRRPRPVRCPVVDVPGAWGPGLRVRRPRHGADLVDRRRGPPEPHLPGAPRPHLGSALLAPGGAGHRGRARATPTATSSSTPTPRTPSSDAGSGWPGTRVSTPRTAPAGPTGSCVRSSPLRTCSACPRRGRHERRRPRRLPPPGIRGRRDPQGARRPRREPAPGARGAGRGPRSRSPARGRRAHPRPRAPGRALCGRLPRARGHARR